MRRDSDGMERMLEGYGGGGQWSMEVGGGNKQRK